MIARGQTGRGPYVDVAMMDGAMLVMAQAFAAHFYRQVPRRGPGQPGWRRPMHVYRDQRRQWITIGSVEPWFTPICFAR